MSQKSLFPEEPEVRADAHLSECGKYRYWLSRAWDDKLPVVCWVMLNPSTADAKDDDPTIRRCVNFARSWNAGGIYVVNLFAFRSPDPAALGGAKDPVGPMNDYFVHQCAAGGRFGKKRLAVVAAWGAHGNFRDRDQAVLALLRDSGVTPQCLGLTKSGQPRHPLYVGAEQPLLPLEVP